MLTIGNSGESNKKPSTPWRSRAVPQPSTTLALHRLAMEFEWDPAFSMQYGRRLIDYRFPIVRFKNCRFPIVVYFDYRELEGLPFKNCRFPIVIDFDYRELNVLKQNSDLSPTLQFTPLRFLHLCRAPLSWVITLWCLYKQLTAAQVGLFSEM